MVPWTRYIVPLILRNTASLPLSEELLKFEDILITARKICAKTYSNSEKNFFKLVIFIQNNSFLSRTARKLNFERSTVKEFRTFVSRIHSNCGLSSKKP